MSPSDRGSQVETPELVLGLKAGDQSSYEELVRRFGARMLGTAQRILANHEDARDTVQEAFLLAFKNIDRFEERAAIGTWLHRITVNCALSKLRSRRRKPETPIEELAPEFDEFDCRIEPRIGQSEPLDRLLARKETRLAVREAIDKLPEPYRSTLLLRDIEELGTRETAEILDISDGAVKTRLHRARAALKKLLEPIVTEA